MERFDQLGLSRETLEVLQKRGFETPSPVQVQTIPALLNGTKDLIAQAQTGTGKTAAFGLPMIERIRGGAGHVQALVLTPTRELAIQVAEEINSLKGSRRLSVVPIYGGQSISLQLRSLKRGVDIVVGTPGRVMDHLQRKTLKIEAIDYLVLDEADEMLNMGFLEDVIKIMKYAPSSKRTLLFSATMPPEIQKIAQKYMGEYDLIKATEGRLTVNKTDQIYFEVKASEKFEALCRIIDIEQEFYGLVFCRTKVDVAEVARHLGERGYDADALHGDMTQGQREQVLNKFKRKQISVLIATDVAARGIDVNNLTHVINFALPQDPEAYVHRIGRTGRAGKEGIAITFVTSSEYRKLQNISKRTQSEIRKEKLPEVRDVIETKRGRIRGRLEEMVKRKPLRQYTEMAKQLLSEHDPETMLAALLQSTFQGDLDAESYSEISPTVVDSQGKTRLFVRSGKKDGLTRKKLLEVMRKECGIDSRIVRDIEILDTFSFVTLPFQEAEGLLSQFKKGGRGSGAMFSKAKPPEEPKRGPRTGVPGGTQRSKSPRDNRKAKAPGNKTKTGERPEFRSARPAGPKRKKKTGSGPSRPKAFSDFYPTKGSGAKRKAKASAARRRS